MITTFKKVFFNADSRGLHTDLRGYSDKFALICVRFAKIRVITLSLLFLLSISFAQEKFPFIGEITKDSVNIRSGPNINYEVFYKLMQGDQVKVVEEKFNWHKIELDKEKATSFIHQKYLESSDGKIGMVSANRVNLRARPNTASTILAQVNKGQVLNIIAKKEEWFLVQPTDNCFGWVSKEFVAARKIEEPKIIEETKSKGKKRR